MALPLLLMHLASPSSMGFGDVKLAVVVGAAVGAADWQLALPALALAAGATATVGIVERLRHVPFGPGGWSWRDDRRAALRTTCWCGRDRPMTNADRAITHGP